MSIVAYVDQKGSSYPINAKLLKLTRLFIVSKTTQQHNKITYLGTNNNSTTFLIFSLIIS